MTEVRRDGREEVMKPMCGETAKEPLGVPSLVGMEAHAQHRHNRDSRARNAVAVRLHSKGDLEMTCHPKLLLQPACPLQIDLSRR